MPKYCVVVIGRNEGERLVRCLKSLGDATVVYVDSGSTDNSVEMSRQLGAAVVSLDMSIPFTAARARNTGVQYLLREYPSLEYVQFVDGDCELDLTWMSRAIATLEQDTELAAVCGRRREIKRDASVYNMLCDIEWNTPVGTAQACGGDAMYRVAAFQQVGGFDDNFIAGEEPELCYRLRQAGWKIRRLDAEMTKHDADMHSLKQWWKRCQRSGFAYALGAKKHGSGPERYQVKSCLSILVWGAAIPLAILLMAVRSPLLGIVVAVGLYGYLAFKVYRHTRTQHAANSKHENLVYSGFIVLQKFPECFGVLRFLYSYALGRQTKIIEYK